MRELRKLLKRVLQLALAECLRSGGNMGRLFKQACGIGADIGGPFLFIVVRLIVVRPAVYRRPPLTLIKGRARS